MNPGQQGRGPAGRRGRKRRVSIKVLVALAVLIASSLMATLTAQAIMASRTCRQHPVFADVAVSADIAPAIQRVGDLFNRQDHLASGLCARVHVVPAAPAAVAAQVDGQGTASSAHAIDAWIPDSSLWVDVARSFPRGAQVVQPTGVDVARSPLMIAMPPTAAARVPAFGPTVGWNFLLPSAIGGPPAALHLRVDIPDPKQSATGLAALIEMNRLLGSGAAARPDFAKFVLATEATPQFEDARSLKSFVALAQPPVDGNPVTVTTEQTVLQYDEAHPGQPLAARYPSGLDTALGSPELDYPYVLTSSGSPELTAAAEFGKLLAQGYAAAVIRFAGFRSADGIADASPGGYGLASQPLQLAVPAAPSEAQLTLQAWQRLRADARDLTLVDVSAAMARPAGPDGQTLEQELTATAGLGLALFPDGTSLGLWEYADSLADHRPYKQLVSVGPVTDELGLISRREQLQQITQLLKPVPGSTAALNEAILAAYKHMIASYLPSYANAVLVLTSGVDNASGDIPLAKLLGDLHRLYNPDRRVEIVIVMFGTSGDFSAMRQIAAAAGGSAYEITSPAQIGDVFFEAIANRICASSCTAP